MAQQRLGGFTPEGARKLADFYRDYSRRPLRGRINPGEVVAPYDRVIRWGRTTTNYDYPTYSMDGGVYVVSFGEYQPDSLTPGDAPDKTFTAYDPVWTEIAVEPVNMPIAQSSVVRCELHDGQWWIRDIPREYKAIADADITAGSYASASLYIAGSVARTIDAYFNWMEAGTTEIASGTEMLVRWFDDEEKWVIVAAECQA